jgi:hypothetical protein
MGRIPHLELQLDLVVPEDREVQSDLVLQLQH